MANAPDGRDFFSPWPGNGIRALRERKAESADPGYLNHSMICRDVSRAAGIYEWVTYES
ncbi:hypothetical protein I6F30_13285 [Bradyrhizobium sp. NBAIM20]|uniref:hypothetical protein n=1 Tax=unclassified Bradyrhizobium TaxID=2631580 RepID=UPI001CD5BDAF|nr:MULTISPECIES: hypothetical protein [unclassified Bradyrhizobium]MCA1412096.1 hypothetical protein [Bradyrhizobium sp. NBAIM20]MCA1461980.1 hypothetical protein [Bradyrhizobium sp. NBAIM18]